MNFPDELEQAFSIITKHGLSNSWSGLTSIIHQEYEINKFEVIWAAQQKARYYSFAN